LKEVIFAPRELANMYFHFLFSVKRLDLLPYHLVTLSELAVQSLLQKYSPQKERNGGPEMHMFTGHIPVDLKAMVALATVAAFPYA
jgi:hypothetical protein